jgi:serine-type D-Ala-D-Ala carboxypeptidase/endopeptidase
MGDLHSFSDLRKMRISLLIFLFSWYAMGAFGQHIDSLVNAASMAFFKNPKHIGLSIGVIKNGKRYTYHYGTTEKGRVEAPTDKTTYEIASVTKSFTGMLLAKAVADKKIGLNEDIRKYLPGEYPNLVFKGQPIRIVNLANHTSGLPKFIPKLDPSARPADINSHFSNFSEDAFLKQLALFRLDTFPGTLFAYSNAGAEVAGIILEKVYNMSYPELIHQFITGPAKMPDTKTAVAPGDLFRLAKGYNGSGEQMPEMSFMRAVPAAGFLKSTIPDMLNYIAFNFAETDPVVLLAHQPTYQHTSERNDGIALFWFTSISPEGYCRVRHAGGSFGFTSFCLLFPERRVGIVCLANDAADGTEHELSDLSDTICRGLMH